MRTVWFHRDYVRFTGGHLKHSHYVGHTAAMPGFVPRIAYTRQPEKESVAEECRLLWPPEVVSAVPDWRPDIDDVLFVAGTDWRFLLKGGYDRLPNPVLNFVQGVRHANVVTELYGYLAHKAIRICVSQEVANAINATGRTNGPVLVIPNGIDVDPAGSGAKLPGVCGVQVVVVGYKRPQLAQPLVELLRAADIEHLGLMQFCRRNEFLEILGESRIAVCLPLEQEGFYLPALEAMAMGCLVVTLDCVGNRGFCRHGENCMIAGPTVQSLFETTERMLRLPAERKERLARQAAATARGYSMDAERESFHALLADIDRIWAAAFSALPPAPTGVTHRPRE